MAIKLSPEEVNELLKTEIVKNHSHMKPSKRPQTIDSIATELSLGFTLEINFDGCNTEVLMVSREGAFYRGSAILSFKDLHRFNRQKAALLAFDKMLVNEKMKGFSNILNDDDKSEIVMFIFENVPNVTYDLTNYVR